MDFWKALIWSAATSLKVSKRSEVFVVAVKEAGAAGCAAGCAAGASGSISISSTAEEKRTEAGASRALLLVLSFESDRETRSDEAAPGTVAATEAAGVASV